MPYAVKRCRCNADGNPRPKACVDDLFCPQCGGAVAWIDSDHLLPAPDSEPSENGTGPVALWVYRSEGTDRRPVYELTLDFYELGYDGASKPRSLILTSACTFRAAGFETKPEIVNTGTSRVTIRLRPLESSNPPLDRGIHGELILAGNCVVPGLVLAGRPGNRTSLSVRLFNPPDYKVEVDGRDGVQRDPEAKNSWQLWKDSPQELNIRVEPIGAPVFLSRIHEPVGKVEGVSFKLIDERLPRANATYRPGEPVVIVLKLDPSEWEKQEGKSLPLQLDFALAQACRTGLTFIRQAEGTLVWSTGNDLVLEPMFYGEIVETPPKSLAPRLDEIVVYNEGVAALNAKVPRIADDASLLRGVRWIETGWADGSNENVTLDAKTGHKSLRLKIDLSEVHEGNHKNGDPLKAQIVVEHADYNKPWPLNITIQSVGHRKPLDSPLAIDFGNTNSYASAELPGERHGEPTSVRSLLGLKDDPETFASALAFKEIEDETKPVCLIGREALEHGKSRPLFLERGLKRALSALRPAVDERGKRLEVKDERHPFNRRRFIYPRDGRDPARYSLRDLIRFYLTAAILRCEEGQRRTVTSIGLSYPANLSPEPRRALNLVLGDLESIWKKRYPELENKIKFSLLGPDEASSVALDFVLDPVVAMTKIKPLFQNNEATFTLAAFDIGGGSIDIALIRFNLKGLPPLTIPSSTLLGIGGDEYFGGDNVTVAAYERLISKIAAILGPNLALPLSPLDAPRDQSDLQGWVNRQAIWDAAELSKRAACRGESASEREGVLEALKRLHAKDAAALGTIQAALTQNAGALDIDLADLYQHTISCDLSGSGSYTVANRLEKCVGILREFVERAGADSAPKFLILAGAGCRIPLARELLHGAFPDSEIIPEDATIPESYHPKSKVANGLARYLRVVQHATRRRVEGLKHADRFNHADVLWLDSVYPDHPVVWAPSCVSLDHKEWHLLPVPLGMAYNYGGSNTIAVHRRTFPKPELIGVANLEAPADLIEEGVTPELPEPSPELDDAQVFLRFDGEEDHLRLRIRIGDAEFGDWSVRPESR